MIKNLIIIDAAIITKRRMRLLRIDNIGPARINIIVYYIKKDWGVEVDGVIENSPICIGLDTGKDLEIELKKYYKTQSAIMLMTDLYWENRQMAKAIWQSGMPIIKFGGYGNVTPLIKPTFFDQMKRFFTKNGFQKAVFNKLLFKIYGLINGARPTDFYFASGSMNHPTLNINHIDYDDYLKMKQNDNKDHLLPPDSYIVYVDTSFGRHPDEIVFRGGKCGDNDLWRKKLCGLFDKLEKKYNKEVVIAMHPEARYTPDEWGGRKMWKYKTLDLVYNSYFAIYDTSSSVVFSIMCKKKILLVYTKEFWDMYKKDIVTYAKVLGLPINMAEKINVDKVQPQQISDGVYKKYLYDYLTSVESENKLTEDIIIQWCKNYKSV